MKSKTKLLALFALLVFGLSSCAQAICPAYAQVDDEEKKDKKEAQF